MPRRRPHFWWRYLTRNTPWDTNITPPELRTLIEAEKFSAGRALDLGCGTGTNSIYLAQQRWTVTGIDFVPTAIRTARRKARQQHVKERTQFLTGDVTKLARLSLDGPFNLVLDIGCLHGLSPDGQAAYLQALPALTSSGGIYLLYAFSRHPDGFGISTEMLTQQLEPAFELATVETGDDEHAARQSAWYRFARQ